jgi:hypothetical protein
MQRRQEPCSNSADWLTGTGKVDVPNENARQQEKPGIYQFRRVLDWICFRWLYLTIPYYGE